MDHFVPNVISVLIYIVINHRLRPAILGTGLGMANYPECGLSDQYEILDSYSFNINFNLTLPLYGIAGTPRGSPSFGRGENPPMRL